MRGKYKGWYAKSPAEIEALWETALFVPDANVLLHCIRHPAAVREELLRLIGSLGDSLWIPYQIGLEFHRNRLEVELAAIDVYDALIRDQEALIERGRERLRQVRAHPTISVSKELAALDMFLSDFRARIETARSTHPSKDIEQAVARLTDLLEGRVGEKWKPDQFIALKKEGDERYAKKIPPGYKDSKKDDGEFAKFGDLIVWKDMIAKAKADNRPVIFISDDLKEDWWWINRGRKVGPRPELVEEFAAESGQAFHIYEFAQFLRFAAQRFPEIRDRVAEVQQSVLADEEARRRLDDAAAAREAELRQLEDERDQIVAALSGTPNTVVAQPSDRSSLKARLEELNRAIANRTESGRDGQNGSS